jgi:hypothetical protein
MNKPFIVINVVDGNVAVVYMRDSEEAALELAVSMAQEQCNEPEEDIRQQLMENWLFVPPNEDFNVCIQQPKD